MNLELRRAEDRVGQVPSMCRSCLTINGYRRICEIEKGWPKGWLKPPPAGEAAAETSDVLAARAGCVTSGRNTGYEGCGWCALRWRLVPPEPMGGSPMFQRRSVQYLQLLLGHRPNPEAGGVTGARREAPWSTSDVISVTRERRGQGSVKRGQMLRDSSKGAVV